MQTVGQSRPSLPPSLSLSLSLCSGVAFSGLELQRSVRLTNRLASREGNVPTRGRPHSSLAGTGASDAGVFIYLVAHGPGRPARTPGQGAQDNPGSKSLQAWIAGQTHDARRKHCRHLSPLLDGRLCAALPFAASLAEAPTVDSPWRTSAGVDPPPCLFQKDSFASSCPHLLLLPNLTSLAGVWA